MVSKVTAVKMWYFWHPHDQKWFDVLPICGVSAAEWARDLRRAGYCIAAVKRLP